MRILFCTNKYANVTNGPAKFARLLLQINERYAGEHELRILTEDVATDQPGVYRLPLRYPAPLQLASQFFRMRAYHRAARHIYAADFPFDVIVYNNALVGLLSAGHFRHTVGMINDSENLQFPAWPVQWHYEFFKTQLFQQFERWATRRFSRIITNSDALTRQLHAHYPALRAKTVRLYKGVQLPDRIKPATDPMHSPLRILFVKTDLLTGGLPDLLAALPQLGCPVSLTLIGAEAAACETFLAPYRRQEGVDFKVLGPQPQTVVFDHMLNWADIFCVPSRREALGVANLEALAHGLAVVTTHVDGIPEAMDYGRNGWLVAPQDPMALASALRECASNTAQRLEYRERGLAFVQQFRAEAVLDRFIKAVAVECTPAKQE